MMSDNVKLFPLRPSGEPSETPQDRVVRAGLSLLLQDYRAERGRNLGRRPVVELIETVPVIVEKDGRTSLVHQPVFEITGWVR